MSQAGTAATQRAGSSSSTASGASSKLTVGARCTIAQDIDVRGIVSIGSGTVIHPKAVIHALSARDDASEVDAEPCRIEIGNDCIIEELAQIIHTGSGTMKIGSNNLFEVGCRIEAQSVGSHNTFECKSRVVAGVAVPDFCTVGVGCVAQPPLDWVAQSRDDSASDDTIYTLPPRSIIYGAESQRRQWSGNGVRQADALHAKHLNHLRRNIPEFHALRIIR